MHAERISGWTWIAVGLGLLLMAGVGDRASAQEQEDLKNLAKRSRSSVVLLEVLGGSGRVVGSGTGFFIDAETVVTNHHVVASASIVRAKLEDGQVISVLEVMAENPESDLAILHVPGASVPGLSLYRGGAVEPGEEVVVLGNPEGLSGTLSTGIVSAWRANRADLAWSGVPLIQITAPISPGSSGSPVMNRQGEVLGVAVAVHRTGQNLNFAVPVDEVRRLVRSVGPEPVRVFGTAGGLGSGLTLNLLISLAVFAGLAVFLRRL